MTAGGADIIGGVPEITFIGRSGFTPDIRKVSGQIPIYTEPSSERYFRGTAPDQQGHRESDASRHESEFNRISRT